MLNIKFHGEIIQIRLCLCISVPRQTEARHTPTYQWYIQAFVICRYASILFIHEVFYVFIVCAWYKQYCNEDKYHYYKHTLSFLLDYYTLKFKFCNHAFIPTAKMLVVHVIEIIIRITLQRTFVLTSYIHFAVWVQLEEVTHF